MNKIQAVIIEDEFPAARFLHSMLQEIRPEWEITVLPGTIEDSVKWFAENPHPDILFLDIQLNDGNSFLFIEQANPQSVIVFTTAYDEYAVQAFTVNSIDYLLKPIHKDRLANAIRRCERMMALNNNSLNKLLDLEQLLKDIAEKKDKQYRTRFLISAPRHFYTIQVADIAYFCSEDKVTFAVTQDGKSHIVDFPLNKLEEQLDGKQFHRVNRQFILSVDSILDIQPYFNGKAIIKVRPSYDGVIQISREKVPVLKLWLDEPYI